MNTKLNKHGEYNAKLDLLVTATVALTFGLALILLLAFACSTGWSAPAETERARLPDPTSQEYLDRACQLEQTGGKVEVVCKED